MMPLHMPTATIDIHTILPEIILLAGAFIALLVDAFTFMQGKRFSHGISLCVLGIAAIACLQGFNTQSHVSDYLLIRDLFSNITSLVIIAIAFITISYGWSYWCEPKLQHGEIPVLILFATAGMLFLVSAGHFIMLYIGLELLALCSYALVGSARDCPESSEAAMKYVLLGSLSSGLLLYGISLVYGATGSLSLYGDDPFVLVHLTNSVMALTGTIFIIAGIAFKLGAAPFHMWLPDVYQGAPTPVALFVSSAPKLAAFGMAYRILNPVTVPYFGYLSAIFAVLSAISLVLGNCTALLQTYYKRLLGFSTVSHIGFVLMGVACGTIAGWSAALFYTIAYAIMSTASFGVLMALRRNGVEFTSIDDFKGLAQRSPWMAASLSCILFSLAGIPPFLGFWAKFAVVKAAFSCNLWWIAVLGLLCAVIGAGYYLRLVQFMYFFPINNSSELDVGSDRTQLTWVAGAHAIFLLVLGFTCNSLLLHCVMAFL